ncbi:MAG: hypothetical protein JWM11_7038, partial [Planctomycetaceae bacterium]|nr:hypothetical protein [Planctomycetaceae bacterium]
IYGSILVIRKLGKVGIALVVIAIVYCSFWTYSQYLDGLPGRTLVATLYKLGARSVLTEGRPWAPVVYAIEFAEQAGDEEVQQLTELSGLDQLHRVSFHESPISDEFVTGLARLGNVKTIYFEDTKVTPEAVDQLRHELPDCEITEKRWLKFTRKARQQSPAGG